MLRQGESLFVIGSCSSSICKMVPQLSLARICKSLSPVKSEPDSQSESTSEVLYGESVLVQEHDALWARIKTERDGYEGFVQTSAYDQSNVSTTHWVCTRSTLLFEQADIKSRVTQRLLFGSELNINEELADGKFLRLMCGRFIWASHCLRYDHTLNHSMTEISQEHYLNAPYLWGGRSTDGCDCSGLVQMLARATGQYLPRDSADQEAYLPSNVEFDNRCADDLVYWPGHVGILQSADYLLHATAHTLRCCVEPLSDVIQRAGNPSSIKRLGVITPAV